MGVGGSLDADEPTGLGRSRVLVYDRRSSRYDSWLLTQEHRE